MNDPRMEPDAATISRLRDEAVMRLSDAARCRDPQECDRLTREALVLLDRARAAGGGGTGRSAWPGDVPPTRTKEDFAMLSRKLTAEFFGDQSPADVHEHLSLWQEQPEPARAAPSERVLSMRLLIVVLLALLAAVLAPLIAHSRDLPSSGTWDTRWREGGAFMVMEQRSDEVTGARPAHGGYLPVVTAQTHPMPGVDAAWATSGAARGEGLFRPRGCRARPNPI